MKYKIRYGVPEIIEYFKRMVNAKKDGTISNKDAKLFKKVLKAVRLLQNNPKHPGLATHEIKEMSKKTGYKVYEAYLENNTPGAARMFWTYGPNEQEITIIGIEPHPDDKKGSYKRVKLSQLPDM